MDFTYTEFSCDDSDDDVDEYCIDDSSNAVADIFISLFGVIISGFYLHTNTVHIVHRIIFPFQLSDLNAFAYCTCNSTDLCNDYDIPSGSADVTSAKIVTFSAFVVALVAGKYVY